MAIILALVEHRVYGAVGAHLNGRCVTSSREADVLIQKTDSLTAKEDGT